LTLHGLHSNGGRTTADRLTTPATVWTLTCPAQWIFSISLSSPATGWKALHHNNQFLQGNRRNMTRPHIIAAFLLGLFVSGCTRNSSVICFAPVEPFEPKSGAELFEEFTHQVPFKVKPKHFICKYKSNHLVGWAIVRSNKKREIVKQKLNQSSSLTWLQVEPLTRQLKAIFKKEWRQSQAVAHPKKELNSPRVFLLKTRAEADSNEP